MALSENRGEREAPRGVDPSAGSSAKGIGARCQAQSTALRVRA